jgi:hypothetical protein
MTFLFMTMENLSQYDYIYDELYEAILIYYEKVYVIKIFMKTS